jgi:hypothetical protein
MGLNMYGYFEKSPLEYTRAELDEIEYKESLKRKKPKRRGYNLEKVGENMIPPVRQRDLPWM